MTLVCFGSVKGSPGVTLTALLTAAAWPTEEGRTKAFVEADPDGGSLALRYRLSPRPGLLSLAAAASNALSSDSIVDHTQMLPGGLPVVIAPPSPEQASVAIDSVGGELGQWLANGPGDFIADVGRLSVNAANSRFVEAADAVLVVCRPVPDQLQPAAQRMKVLAASTQVGWVLIGQKPYSPSDVSEAFGFPVVAALTDEPKTATAITSGVDPHRLKRSSLTSDVATFASSMSGWMNERRRTAETDFGVGPEATPEGTAGLDSPLDTVLVESERPVESPDVTDAVAEAIGYPQRAAGS